MNTSPKQSGYLKVGNGHEVYFWTAGNPQGKSALYVHGGPGSGTDAGCLKYFDLDTTYVIFLDQRGCGQSKAVNPLLHNTTQDLVGDLEALRQHLKLERWTLFGGSWGSTLALVYAITHPQVVEQVFLRALFLGREQDWAEMLLGLGKLFYPYEHQTLLKAIPQACRTDFTKFTNYFYEVLQGNDSALKTQLANAWVKWENTLLSPISYVKDEKAEDANFTFKLALLECHYAKHHSFLKPNFILENVAVLKDKPVHLIHGRFDLVCPLSQALELKRALPTLNLYVTNNAGHSGSDPNNLTTIKHLLKTQL